MPLLTWQTAGSIHGKVWGRVVRGSEPECRRISTTWLCLSLIVHTSLHYNRLSDLDDKAIALCHNVTCTNAQNKQKLWGHQYQCPLHSIFGGPVPRPPQDQCPWLLTEHISTSLFASHQPTTVPVWAQSSSLQTRLHDFYLRELLRSELILTYLLLILCFISAITPTTK